MMSRNTKVSPDCAHCPFNPPERLCRNKDGKFPPFCPTFNKAETISKAVEEYEKPATLEFAKQASIQEAEGFCDRELGYDRLRPIKPRILEVIEFAQKMKYRRLGLVFCEGLRREAAVFEGILLSNDFEVISVVCKLGRIPKEKLGVRDDQKVNIGSAEPMCNPISQASVVNSEKTEFNILLGLCVGHDSLFLKHAEAPCTVLAVKDRLLGHNPLAAIYTIDTYYRSIKNGTPNHGR